MKLKYNPHKASAEQLVNDKGKTMTQDPRLNLSLESSAALAVAKLEVSTLWNVIQLLRARITLGRGERKMVDNPRNYFCIRDIYNERRAIQSAI